MARLSKQIKNKLVAYVNDREKGKKKLAKLLWNFTH